jgi:hypothetical protein
MQLSESRLRLPLIASIHIHGGKYLSHRLGGGVLRIPRASRKERSMPQSSAKD